MTIPHNEARERLKEDLGMNISPKKVNLDPVANEPVPKKPISVPVMPLEDRLRLGLEAATNAAQYSASGTPTQERAAEILLEFSERLLYPS